jgi:hypothetical protein
MPSHPNVSGKRDEVNRVHLSEVSVTFSSRLRSPITVDEHRGAWVVDALGNCATLAPDSNAFDSLLGLRCGVRLG